MLKQDGKIVLDPFIANQYSIIYNNLSKESNGLNYLKSELAEFKNIETAQEARDLVYKKYPKFKESKTFINMGIKYCLKDNLDSLTLIVYFNDSIECFTFQE